MSTFLDDPDWAGLRPEDLVYIHVLRIVINEGTQLKARAGRRPGAAPPVVEQPSPAQRELKAQLRRWKRRLEEDNRLRHGLRRAHAELWFWLRPRHRYLRYWRGQALLTLSVAEQGLLAARTGAAETYVRRMAKLQARLEARGIALIVVPVPESLTIYPELLRPAERAQLTRPAYLDQLLGWCGRLGLSCVDLRPTFQAHREPYLYELDDTHWRPRAMGLAAAELAPWVRARLRPEAGATGTSTVR